MDSAHEQKLLGNRTGLKKSFNLPQSASRCPTQLALYTYRYDGSDPLLGSDVWQVWAIKPLKGAY